MLMKLHKSTPDTSKTGVTIAPGIGIQVEIRKLLNIHSLRVEVWELWSYSFKS